MSAKPWVANQYIDLLLSQDIAEHGLQKLKIMYIEPICEPFEDDIMTRLAQKCPYIKNLELKAMNMLSEVGRMQVGSLFR